MAKKWPKNGKVMEFSIIFPFFDHFLAIFAPVQLGAVFHFDFHFFPISGLWPFSMPYQPARIPTLGEGRWRKQMSHTTYKTTPPQKTKLNCLKMTPQQHGLKDVVLWFGAFVMKILDFLRLFCAGSGLPQGPLLGNKLFPLKVGLRWVFVNGMEWVKSGFLGAKVGKNGSKPTFAPTLNPFRDFHENPLFTQFKGGGNCFLKAALRQSRPSIKIVAILGGS